MPGKIFINYRRGDDPGHAGRLFDRLQDAFAREQLFMDVDSIAPGFDFVRVLEEQVAACDVLLVVIGKGWVDARDGAGGRSLEDPGDFVRIEIEAGLRFGKRVIPVLVNGAEMPRAEVLPEALDALSRRHAVRLTHDQFKADAERLIKVLGAALDEAEKARVAEDAAAMAAGQGDEDGTEAGRLESDSPDPPGRGPIKRRSAALRWGVAAAVTAAAIVAVLAQAPRFGIPVPWREQSDTEQQARTDADEVAREAADEQRRQEEQARRDAQEKLQAAIAAATDRNALFALLEDNPAARTDIEARLGALGYVRVGSLQDGKLVEYWLKPGGGDGFRDCASCPEMVVVPAGGFMMGSPATEPGRYDNEGPQRAVAFAAPFAVGRLTVTVDQFSAFANATEYDAGSTCSLPIGGQWVETPGRSWRDPGFAQSGSHPAVCLSWNDAKAYVDWLARETGQSYRLLTEAEWEYAARADTTSRYFFGDDEKDFCRYGNAADLTAKQANAAWTVLPCDDGYIYTAPAGSFAPNKFGLYDVLGNAWQWVEDCYHDGYAGAPADGSAWTTGDCSRRVLRGGSWYSFPRDVRTANRERSTPDMRDTSDGFRVARMLQ